MSEVQVKHRARYPGKDIVSSIVLCYLQKGLRPFSWLQKSKRLPLLSKKSLYRPAAALNQEYSNCFVRQTFPNSVPFSANIFPASANTGPVSKIGKASKAIALILVEELTKELNGDAARDVTARPAIVPVINSLRCIEN